jgi:hypothetical protein
MSRKRRVVYPPSRSSKGPAPVYTPPVTPPTVAVINRQASTGRADITVGMRVMILGTGLFAGETAVVESMSGGVIPAANVRTESGKTRRVRTIDLAPAPAASPPQAAAPAQAAAAPASQPAADDVPAPAVSAQAPAASAQAPAAPDEVPAPEA